MWVKTTLITGFCALLLGCAGPALDTIAPTRTLVLPVLTSVPEPAADAAKLAPSASAAVPFGLVSLLCVDGGIAVVFTDARSASLEVIVVTRENGMIPQNPAISRFADRIADPQAFAAGFGAYAAASIRGTLHLLYLDSKANDEPILKWLSRSRDAKWMVDALESAAPARPVAVCDDGEGNAVPFWISGTALMARFPDGSVKAVFTPLQPEGRVTASETVFAVHDAAARILDVFHLEGRSVDHVRIPESGPAACTGLTPVGLPALATFSPAEKRIFLHEGATGTGAMRKTAVTAVDFVTGVFFRPVGTGYIFLYDASPEAGSSAGGRPLHLLVHGARGYRRLRLDAARIPDTGFAAAVDVSGLYVLILEGDLKLFETRLPN